MQTRTATGWILAALMVGASLHLASQELADVGQWAEVQTPHFVSVMLEHIAILIGTFAAGQAVPTMTRPPIRPPKE